MKRKNFLVSAVSFIPGIKIFANTMSITPQQFFFENDVKPQILITINCKKRKLLIA